MKKEIRIIGFDDSPFDKFKDKEVLVVGTFFRGGDWMDGVLSSKIKIDGNDSTEILISMINKCKFKPQIRVILLNGIAFGGFNVIDITRLNRKTKIPVIVVIRKMPDFEKIKKTLKQIGQEEKYRLIEKAGKVHKIGKIYVQFVGMKLNEVNEVIKLTCIRSLIPEPIRIAHLIGAGIVSGESKGNA